MPTLLVFVSLLLPAQTTRPVDLKNLPADWPPLPDFKHTVDYVKWWEECTNTSITDDARPLWNELRGHEDASEEAQETNHLLWGEDKEGAIPGLFTSATAGFDPQPWDPRNHLDWETAYQSQEKYGLVRKLREAAERHSLSTRLRIPRNDFLGPAGFTNADRLVLRYDLCPFLSTMRKAVKVLLQNAWRAPEGKVDHENMRLAIITSLQIAVQIQSSEKSIINLLVAAGIRKVVCDAALEALDRGAIGAGDIADIEKWLARNDNQPLTVVPCYASEVAIACDLLQFAYLPQNGVWPRSPVPNAENVKKLSGYARIMSETARQMPDILGEKTVLDLNEQIGRCDPATGVRQLVDVFSKCRQISSRELPWAAVEHGQQVWKRFIDDAGTHVIFRQFLAGSNYPELIVAASETSRRAMRIVFAVHGHRIRTGKWPVTLSELRPILPVSIRTDPFSGKPFIYRLENGRPLLYSTGYNAKDDGGKHVPYPKQEDEKDGVSVTVEGDYVYWPVQKEK